MVTKADPKSMGRNTHDIILTYDGEEVPLIVVNGRGEHDPRSIDREPINQSSLKFYQNQQKHSDMEPPWQPVAQENWTGGFGSKIYENDSSAFWDSNGLNTTKRKEFIQGPFPMYCTGLHNWAGWWNYSAEYSSNYEPIQYRIQSLSDDQYYMACKFTPGSTFVNKHIHLILKKYLSPEDMTIAIYSESGGEPDALLASTTLEADDFPWDNVFMEWIIDLEYDSLSSGTDYFLVLSDTASTIDIGRWSVMTSDSLDGKEILLSDDGSTWDSQATSSFFFRMLPEYQDFKAYFVEHKRALIAGINYDDGTKSEVYLSGDAGTATGGSTTTIVDTTKTWTTDEKKGYTVMLVGGTGSIQRKNYSIITSNTSNTLTIDDLDVGAAAGSEYVILNDDKWISISPSGGDAWPAGKAITDMKSSRGAIYFAHGDATSMSKLQRYTSGGAWVNDYDIEGNAVGSILSIGSDLEGEAVYIAKRTKPEVYRAPSVDATGAATADDLVPVSLGLVGDGALINGMCQYGEYGELTVFTQNSFYQYFNGKFAEKRVPEMKHTQDDRNGRGQEAAGVYLYFTWHNTVVRFYDSNLDSVGPNNSEMNMYKDRQGHPTEMTAYVGGMLFVAFDGGETNYSTIICWNGSGWHEYWRAPVRGRRIYNVYANSVEGDAVDWLYVSCGSDIVKLPIHENPSEQYDWDEMKIGDDHYNHYPFRWGGWLETSWITLNLYNVEKFFYSLAMVWEGEDVRMFIDYKLDDGE
jgi:hypothetical protein